MMSDSNDDLFGPTHPPETIGPAARFEMAWEAVARGGIPPSIDDYIAAVDELGRRALAEELRRIERTYRIQLSFGSADTIVIQAQAIEDHPPFSPGETFVSMPEPSQPSSSASTADPIPSPEPRQDELDLSDVSCIEPAPTPPMTVATFVLDDPYDLDRSNPREPALPSNRSEPIGSWIMDSVDESSSNSAIRPLSGRPLVDGYEILGELGRGGMGIVYKARQRGLNRLVAIKMVLGGEQARHDDLARFKIEAQSVASIQHPNIVQIYEVGENEGRPYFSLEFIDGGTLQQKINGKPQLPSQAAEIVHKLAMAMQSVHQHGVIHRDLKPANVLMTLQGTPKITDFGLAKRVESDSRQTRTGSLLGTPSYMAPEQARGDLELIGPLSDLYSLGAILYELLTGRPPFQGATMLDTMEQVRSQEPVPPTKLQPKIPRDLETICLKCLQKEPSKRYPSVAELGADLERYLVGEPIRARPVGKVENAWRWVKRNPKLAYLSASIFGLMTLLLVVAAVSMIRSFREYRTINEARRIALDRLTQGSRAIESGDVRRAIDILGTPDPLIERTPALREVRDELRKLRSQVVAFGEFRQLLDHARYQGFMGSEQKLIQARNSFRDLFTLYEEIDGHKGRGEFGLPPLSEKEFRLFKEDVFETFLVAAELEVDLARSQEAKREAALRSIAWLDQAEKLLPPTRVLYVHRQRYKEMVGDIKGYEADKKRSDEIAPNSPIDHLWRGIADRMRADNAVGKGQVLLGRQFYGSAKVEFARLLEARPGHFWGYLEWAGCNLRNGNYYDAMVGYTACIDSKPEAPFPYHNRANAHNNAKEYVEALTDENTALKLEPDYLDAYLGRATAYQGLGKYSLALADLRHAIEMMPSRVETLFQRASVYFESKDYQKAIEDYTAFIKARPKQAGAYRDRAQTYLMLRKFDEAIADWTVVSSLVPENYEAHYYSGVLHLGLLRYDEALRELEDCLKIAPRYAKAFLARAQIWRWLGDDESALKDINQVIGTLDTTKLDAPTKASYLNTRADLYLHLGRLDDSENDSRRSIALDPKQVDAYLSLALVEKKRNKPQAVAGWYEKMIEAIPQSLEARLRYAEFLRDQTRWDEALTEVEKASRLERSPSTGLSRLVGASILAAHGQADLATSQADSILGKSDTRDGDVLLAAAHVWSLASHSAELAGDHSKSIAFADRASSLLERALTVGFHDLEYEEHNRLADDPALAPIMNRPEVKRLVSHRH